MPVASFTFCSPLAQAEEQTNHRKTRTAVSAKSWCAGKKHCGSKGQTLDILKADEEKRTDGHIQALAQSLSPCKRACSPGTPAAPPCCRGSRQWPRPQRTQLRRRSLPPGAWWQPSGCRWWRCWGPGAPGSTWKMSPVEKNEERFSGVLQSERALRFSPEGVLEVGVEGLVGAVAAQHGHNVPPKETAAAPKSKDRRELCGHEEKFQGRSTLAQLKVCPASCWTGEDEDSLTLTCNINITFSGLSAWCSSPFWWGGAET